MGTVPSPPLSFLFKDFDTLACLSFGKVRSEVLPSYIRIQVTGVTTGNWMESRETLEVESVGLSKD